MATKQRQRKKKEYTEDEGWASAFQRKDNTPPQPQFTGQGLLDRDTLKQIAQAGGEFQIAIWSKDGNGKTLRNRDGTVRLRAHIEPPYENNDDDDGDGITDGDDTTAADDDDLPF